MGLKSRSIVIIFHIDSEKIIIFTPHCNKAHWFMINVLNIYKCISSYIGVINQRVLSCWKSFEYENLLFSFVFSLSSHMQPQTFPVHTAILCTHLVPVSVSTCHPLYGIYLQPYCPPPHNRTRHEGLCTVAFLTIAGDFCSLAINNITTFHFVVKGEMKIRF